MVTYHLTMDLQCLHRGIYTTTMVYQYGIFRYNVIYLIYHGYLSSYHRLTMVSPALTILYHSLLPLTTFTMSYHGHLPSFTALTMFYYMIRFTMVYRGIPTMVYHGIPRHHFCLHVGNRNLVCFRSFRLILQRRPDAF